MLLLRSDRLWAVKHAAACRSQSSALSPAAFLLSSCEGLGGISPIFPTPVSPNGQDIYNTYIWISIPAIIIFIGVEAALLWVVLRYRRSKQPVGYVPPQIHGHNGLEIAWTVAPLIVVLVIAGYSFVTLQKDFQPITNADMDITITGHQFGWTYAYPDGFTVHQEGTLAGDVTPFVVPVNKLVRLSFESHRRHPLVVGAGDLRQDRRRPRLHQLLVAEDRPGRHLARRMRRAVRRRPQHHADHRAGDGPAGIRRVGGEAEGGGPASPSPLPRRRRPLAIALSDPSARHQHPSP